MKRRLGLTGLIGLALVGGTAGVAHAAPVQRVSVNQKGDFALIGNTLGHDCGGMTNPGAGVPILGTVNCAGAAAPEDSAPDVFWRADDATAAANQNINVNQARSTAVLTLPPGATVTHAFLYWAARQGSNNPDLTATLDRPGGFTANLTASGSNFVDFGYYQSRADITALVQEHGSGAYRVGGVNSNNLVTGTSSTNFAGWWMVVLYQLDTEPPRNLTIFDGLDEVDNNTVNATLSGFLVPPAGYTARLGVVAYEGDATITGDTFSFDGAQLSNAGTAANPANNFFNSTRSNLGNAATSLGDLPQLTGAPGSLSGLDIDIFDVTAQLAPLQTSAPIAASSTGDIYLLGGFVTSVSTFKPDFTSSNKTAVDVNGGALLPGDVIQYTVNVVNSGNDTSINTVMTDVLPAGVTYVPGSLAITSGANMGPKTDAAGDDQGNFANGTVTVRLGTGANATQGGTMTVGATAVVTFQVTVDATASGTISNQAVINAGGQQGSPPENTPTDGNGPAGGSPPTDVVIDLCETDADCSAPTPYCNIAGTPNTCVECVLDVHCGGLNNACDLTTNTCVCIPQGPEICGDNTDNDCNGTIDDGCTDTDNDGLYDQDETAAGTDPNDADSDDDGVLDGDEPSYDEDTDGDGIISALDPDSDNDGLFDGTELGLDCSNPATDQGAMQCIPDGDAGATTTDPLDPDSDNGGVNDGMEDLDHDGMVDPTETNPTAGNGADDVLNNDTDGDGVTDVIEIYYGTDPNDTDSDDDGVSDGEEPGYSTDDDNDGIIGGLDPDSDNDGIFDGTEIGNDCSDPGTDQGAGNCIPDADDGATTTDPLDPDTDNGGVPDGTEDANHNGTVDGGETNPNDPGDDIPAVDTDDDGIPDDVEEEIGSDPNDADTDDDGVSDGDEPGYDVDTDGDGLINVIDVDSDNDGIYDGTELGLDCSNPDTDQGAGHCIPDADDGATTTDPLDPDTDDGGVPDGQEDLNHDGAINNGETDPNDPSDDVPGEDSDSDGLSDDVEVAIGTDPNDADSDDDGVIDGGEPNYSDDHDGDGQINALDPDSDGDGLFDGTELGLDCSATGTDQGAGNCIPDGDGGATTTNPLDADTDDGGVPDGAEDFDHDGTVDPDEGDPNDPSDDATVDTDGDGLTNIEEEEIGTDPLDADSDDDGATDGEEPDYDQDSDGDGNINALDPDSDDDGLFDGTELGHLCNGPGTDQGAMNCIPDADNGATTTDPLDPDTDDGGVTDGDEDENHDGVVDQGETDPNDPSDDVPPQCQDDSDCGNATSGQICDTETNTCVPGCRGTDGNSCPDGQVCSSADDSAGTCSTVDENNPDDIFAEGNGLLCAARPGATDRSEGLALAMAALAGLALLRRRRSR